MHYSLHHAYRSSCSILRLQLLRPHQIPAVSINYRRSFTGVSSSPELLSISDIPAPHIGHIRVIGLRSPHNRNALSKQLLAELRHEIVSLDGHDGSTGGTRVLVLASELDEAFCAGADLKERSRMTVTETHFFLDSLRATFHAIANLGIPTISAVSSVALGGGLELALTTSLRVFSEHAIVGLPETRLGIVPGAGGSYRLESLIGSSRARQLILTGMRVKGTKAWQMGICNYIVHHKEDKSSDREADVGEDVAKASTERLSQRRQEVLDRALKVARQICRGAPVAVAVAMLMTKMNPYKEDRLYNTCLRIGRADRDEGLEAFKQKRDPVYRGSDFRSNSFSKKLFKSKGSGNLEMVGITGDSGQQSSIEGNLQHASELERGLFTKPEKPRALGGFEKSWDSGNLGFMGHGPKLNNRNDEIEVSDPAEEKEMEFSEHSGSIHDLFDDTFDEPQK